MPKSWRWDKSKGQYRDSRGKIVTDDRLYKIVNDVTANAQAEVGRITSAMVGGTMTTAEWRVAMLDNIKLGNRAMALLAYGGATQMTAREWGRVGAVVREQNKLFAAFAAGVESGDITLGAGVVNRAQLYMGALYAAFAKHQRAREIDGGATLARRILDDAATHCEDCPDLASDDFKPIDQVPEIGDSACNAGCRCRIEYQAEAALTLPNATRDLIQNGPAYVNDGGNTESDKIAVRTLGLSWSNPFPAGLVNREVRMSVDIDDITLGRDALKRQNLLTVADAIARDGIKESGKGIEPIRLSQRADGSFVVGSNGNHTAAALKLMGYRGAVSVLARLQSKRQP